MTQNLVCFLQLLTALRKLRYTLQLSVEDVVGWYRLGLLVWQDMPAMVIYGPGSADAADQAQFDLESKRHIEVPYVHPVQTN